MQMPDAGPAAGLVEPPEPLPPEFAAIMRPELPSLVEEIAQEGSHGGFGEVCAAVMPAKPGGVSEDVDLARLDHRTVGDGQGIAGEVEPFAEAAACAVEATIGPKRERGADSVYVRAKVAVCVHRAALYRLSPPAHPFRLRASVS